MSFIDQNIARKRFSAISRGTTLVLFGFVATLIGTALPWVVSARGVVLFDTTLPLSGIDLVTAGVLLGPLPVVLFGAVAAVVSLFVDRSRGRHAEAVLGTLVVVVVLPYVFSPGFLFSRYGSVAGVNVVETGIGVYLAVLGAVAMIAGAQVGYGE